MVPCSNPPLIELTNQKKPRGYNPCTCIWTNKVVPRHHHLLPPNPSSQHSRPPWQPLLCHHRPCACSMHPTAVSRCCSPSTHRSNHHHHGSRHSHRHRNSAIFNLLHHHANAAITNTSIAPAASSRSRTTVNDAPTVVVRTYTICVHRSSSSPQFRQPPVLHPSSRSRETSSGAASFSSVHPLRIHLQRTIAPLCQRSHHCHQSHSQGRNMEAETVILERDSLHHVSASDCTVKLVKYGQLVNGATKLVKFGQKVKDWSNERGLTANIHIFGSLCKIGLQNWKWAI